MDIELPDPFPTMTYAEAMKRFGSDRPDLRCPLELTDVEDDRAVWNLRPEPDAIGVENLQPLLLGWRQEGHKTGVGVSA